MSDSPSLLLLLNTVQWRPNSFLWTSHIYFIRRYSLILLANKILRCASQLIQCIIWESVHLSTRWRSHTLWCSQFSMKLLTLSIPSCTSLYLWLSFLQNYVSQYSNFFEDSYQGYWGELVDSRWWCIQWNNPTSKYKLTVSKLFSFFFLPSREQVSAGQKKWNW